MRTRIWLCSLALLTAGFPLTAAEEKPAAMQVEYKAQDYSRLLGMPGFQDVLLKMHFQLYQGYVNNTNMLLKSLADFSMKTPLETYSYGALKRRLGWEFDGMRLHEYYFENLGGRAPLETSAGLYKAIEQNFGSFEMWKSDFIATAMMRGIGWVILCRDPQNGRLLNVWIAEHDLGHLAGAAPLLVLDVWEHAYLTQFGLDRPKYIEAFFNNVDWNAVQARLNAASR